MLKFSVGTYVVALVCAAGLAGCGKAPAPAEPVQNVAPIENVAPIQNEAVPAPANAAPARPVALEPLKETDGDSLAPGCFCTFSTGNYDQLLTLSSTKALIRLDGKLKTCTITEAQSDALTGGEGEFTCEGYKITLKGKGEIENGEDSHSRDGALTISRGADSKTYKGSMECAC